ncbi:MAG: hypothetical protein Q8880_06090, partial [Bacteroidota bacterium]|nr:hypothetical protein [Bacteroidota bacterium]
MKKLKSLLIVTLLIFIVRVVNGITPPNDKCSNSEIIKISKSGFGLGVFRSKAVLMKDATTDPGEFFESTLSNYGLNQKSIWFKFTLPTARSVNITLKQYGNNISVYSAGFAVYYSDDCNMNNDKLYKAKITPINMISSSFNPNLMTGTYYIQVGANNSVNDSLYIELNINKPDAMNQYDLSKDAYDFGIVPDLGKKQMNFEVGGQTIDDSTEVCSDVLGYNYRDFTGSAWFKFETNNLPGFLSVGIGSTEFNSPYSSSNPIIFGYRIYKGDITKNGANGVSLFKDCNKLIQYNSNLTGFGFDCGELDSNTIYSVQVFIHKAFSGNVMIEINNYRIKSEFPNIKSMIGKGEHILNHNNCSDSTKIIDGFGCNSMLQNNADSVLIPTVFENNGRTYDMNFWKIIKIENDANITMSIPNHGLGVYVKIFNGDVRKGKCDILLEGNDFDYPKIFNCMHAGIYSIQVLGTKKLYNYTEIGDNNESNFGKKYDIIFLVCDKKSINNFSLKDSLSIEKINMNNSLIDKNLYYTTSDTIGCRGTVFPGKLQGTTTNKIIYRTFRLDSSGLIRLFDLSPYFDYAIYKGDALDMAKKQNKWNEGDTLSEMEKIKEMFSTNNQDYYMGCLSAGIYTIASISKTSCSTYTESPIIIYNKTGITYSDSLHPGNLGDINKTMIWGDTVSKNIFSCDENFKVIDGHSCIDKSLMLYREFYISDSKNIMIQSSHKFNLFNGKVSEVGASGLKFEGNGCDKIWNKDSCYKLSIGWHTIVSYGDPKYDAGTVNFFVFICDTMTQFGNPAMPDFLDINIPDDSNVDFPGQYSEFYMKWETFPCDTNMGSCHCSLNGEEYKFCGKPGYRISFFMFKLYNPSYLEIRDLGKPLITELFPVDIRTVTKFSDIGIPVQPCIEPEPNLPLQFCNLQPGYYTFVVTGPEGIKFRPKLIIRNMKITKHDAAINSYDFGRIKGDGINYTGKEGDVPNGKYNVPSTDFFSCTAGAYRSDPGFNEVKPLCNAAKDYLFNEVSIPYPTPPNYAINANDSNNMTIPRRNIWYTFTSIGSGKITVTVKNKYNSRDTTSFPFSVYSSDEDGNKSFNQLNNEGKVDSTINQGLKFICNNSLTYVTDSGIVCGKNSDTASFWIGQCDNLKAKRYYVIVEMIDGWGASARCDVGIQFDTIHHFNLNYDYYSNANIINGKNEITEPYTKVKLDTGVYVGAKGCFACATRSPYDQDTCGTKTLWYKFEALNHTIFRINYDIPETQITDFKNNDVMLFKETLPGDSTINGLKNISLTPVNALSKPWGECFIDSGVYYIMFTGCNFIKESVIPRIWLINNPGDYCTNAVLLNSTNIGSVSNSLNIEGHTIGEGYGEDGSNMSCLSGPDGYKSSWFNLHLDMKDKVNLTFKLEENTNALSNEIRYRVFYGNCKSLTPGQC